VPTRQSTEITPADRRHVRAIRDRLRVVYAIPVFRPHEDGIAELILTVLSQSTNDRNRDIAYFGLTERFPTWEQVRDAPVEEVELAIRRGGISKIKSARIKAILDAITDTAASAATEAKVTADARPAAGEVSIDWLAHVPVAAAQEYLCSLPGVGRKTAACVLLFSYGMADVPVDTHVSRVGTRLGIFPEKASLLEMHDRMLAITPKHQEWELHLNLLRHGRRICAARKPLCRDCALARMCPSRGLFVD
jgi:endonuclease III